MQLFASQLQKTNNESDESLEKDVSSSDEEPTHDILALLAKGN